MSADGNAPIGASLDCNNPANQPKVELPKVYRTISISFEVGVEVPDNYTDADLQDAAELWMKRWRITEPINYICEVV